MSSKASNPGALEGGQVTRLALTRCEAAEALGVKPITIDRWTSRGLLNPSRASRRPLYLVSDLQRFLEQTRGSLREGGNS